MVKKGPAGRGVPLNSTYYEFMTQCPAGASPEGKSVRTGPGKKRW